MAEAVLTGFPAQIPGATGSGLARWLGHASGLAVAAVSGCVNLSPLAYERDFGTGPGLGEAGPNDRRTDATESGPADLGLDDGPRPRLPDARPPGLRCPADRDCSAQVCDLDPVCRVSCGDCGAAEACQGGRCVPAPPECPEARNCAGRVCGLDAVCGVSCGDCRDDEVCTADARCEPRGPQCPEDAACGGGRCGPDPVCGIDCGGCGPGEVCDDGRCACAPACAGRTCGDDGCGGRCGACAGAERCTPQGRCVCDALVCGASCCALEALCVEGRCCAATLRTVLDFRPLTGPVAESQGERVLVGGTDVSGPVVAGIDACDGRIVASGGPSGLEFLAGGAVFALTPVADEVVIAGAFGDWAEPAAEGFIGRLERATLRDLGVRPTITGWHRALSGDGGTGTFATGGRAGGAFTISTHSPDLRSGCVDDVAEAGQGFAAVVHGGRRWAAGTSSGQAVVFGFGPDCPTWNPARGDTVCACEQVQEVRLELPETPRIELRALAFGPAGRFAAGFATRAAGADDSRGLLASLGQNGALLTRLEWDPTPNADALTGLATAEGLPLFASAFSDRPTVEGGDDGRAAAHLLLIDPATGQITRDVVLGRGRALGVAVVRDGVVVVVDGPDGAALLRCTTAGVCP